jgi:hypothetical protein
MFFLVFLLFFAFQAPYVCSRKILIEIYTEILCPDCIRLIKTSLHEALTTPDFQKLADLKVYPFGNGQIRQKNGRRDFICQHGATECYGNLL